MKTYKNILGYYIIMSNEEKTPNELLMDYINIYLAPRNRESKGDELEVKFGTKQYNQITKIDFDNIIQKLKSLGFTKVSEEYYLNIIAEYADERTGRMKDSNIRATISGISNIQRYCKENMIYEDKLNNITFMQKFRKKERRDGETLRPIDFHDFHFRVNYKSERNMTPSDRFPIKPEIIQMLDNWKDTKKTFRFIKRYTFKMIGRENQYPYQLDLSIVKTNKQRRLQNGRKVYIKEYSIQDANVFNEPENYEVEMEVIKRDAQYLEPDILTQIVKKGIKIILSGWQGTNFPISYLEQDKVKNEYMQLIHGKENVPRNQNGQPRRAHTGDFIGPSSISLEQKNIMPIDIDSSVPNINRPYTVTDKADGERKLLFINKVGKIYLIDTNMRVQFTGSVTKHKSSCNTIIDGEHVLNDKVGNFINLFLCFDIYFLDNENTKGYPFMNIPNEESKYADSELARDKFRGNLLSDTIERLDDTCIIRNYATPLNIKMKNFYTNIGSNIFKECKKILDGVREGILFNYETDGLIFTPCDKSVGSSKVGEITQSRKIRWDYSLKWKPPKFNTIDFLVKTKKIENGDDLIGNMFREGVDLQQNEQLNQYKTLILHVGFDENKHGFLNPCDDIINDKLPRFNERTSYKAMPFIPYDPMPAYPIYTTNIILSSNNNLLTEDKQQVFQDDMVVEFRWENNNEQGWQWVPIRVRYDKTAEYQRKGKITCNAYTTAEGVWRSINKPVTEKMIATGLDIPDVVDDNIYYDRSGAETNTKALRDFHNRYVKRKLIVGVSKRGDTLIDMSVGMGGDLQKWIDAKLSFVFGVDYAKDNIHNRIKGACSRYLRMKKKYKTMPGGLFIQANSSLNIKNGDACFSEKGKQIVKALNGDGPRDEKILGKGVYKRFGIARNGFNIVSNQFSIHYFFQNRNTFYNFIRNLSENCKVGGLCIGTCYDGNRVFRMLQSKKTGESVFIKNKNGTKMWDVKKLYTQSTFPDDDTSLGYAIDVYQESINKTFTEYLVNFDFLIRTMENYGFVPINDGEAQRMGFPLGIGSFENLYDAMEEDIESGKTKVANIGKATKMTPNEKTISFLNNYFIFKKVRNPNPKQITDNLLTISQPQEQLGEEESKKINEVVKPSKKRPVRKYKKKLKLPK
tara:strand:+ start:27894 stop:31316 length:3423 start_codon:yes stop_codon:yes gene_type:complete